MDVTLRLNGETGFDLELAAYRRNRAQNAQEN